MSDTEYPWRLNATRAKSFTAIYDANQKQALPWVSTMYKAPLENAFGSVRSNPIVDLAIKVFRQQALGLNLFGRGERKDFFTLRVRPAQKGS